MSNTKAMLFLDVSLEDQKYNLFEDILQVTYTNGAIEYTIDIGWYPEDFEVSEDSFFWIQVIANENWSDLVYQKKTKDLTKLSNFIQEAIQNVRLQMSK